jgi:hypothetical protein
MSFQKYLHESTSLSSPFLLFILLLIQPLLSFCLLSFCLLLFLLFLPHKLVFILLIRPLYFIRHDRPNTSRTVIILSILSISTTTAAISKPTLLLPLFLLLSVLRIPTPRTLLQ